MRNIPQAWESNNVDQLISMSNESMTARRTSQGDSNGMNSFGRDSCLAMQVPIGAEDTLHGIKFDSNFCALA